VRLTYAASADRGRLAAHSARGDRDMSDQTRNKVRDWWQTEIVDVQDGQIRYRGYAIEDLIGNVGFVDMVWLLLRGDLPDRHEAKLLEAAMVSSVNAGPMSPSCAIAAMAITCGVGLNNA